MARMPGGWLGNHWYGEVRMGLSAKPRKALLDYCGQDTLALVRLLEELRLTATSHLEK